MKSIIILIACIGLIGCEFNNQNKPEEMYNGTQLRTICVDGVAYIKWSNSLTVKLHQDGKPYICVDTDTKVIIK